MYSDLLKDLRNEQHHYERSIHGDGRAESLKRIADHIEKLENCIHDCIEVCDRSTHNMNIAAIYKRLSKTVENINE